MSHREYAHRSTISVGSYFAATAVILGGFFGLLVFAAYPALTTAAVLGLTIGTASGRITRKTRELACRLGGDCQAASEGPEAGAETA